MAYGLIADLHLFNWSAFSTTLESGVNSRLQLLLDEVSRCAEEVRRQSGGLMVVAGDVFHVRGSVAPSVLNPVVDCFAEIAKQISVVVIPGNHDLEGKNSQRISSAVTALEGVGVTVIHETTRYGDLVLVPWVDSVSELKKLLEEVEVDRDTDLILHAPVNGVIKGIPDNGLDPAFLSSLKARGVFAGHYHNNKQVYSGAHSTGCDVHSIGAIAHHTWSDVGSRAGFLIVGDSVVWHKSHAPEFIDLPEDIDELEAELIIPGNYVRAKVANGKVKEVNELREWLIEKCGAKGVTINVLRESTRARAPSATVSAGASLEVSIADYIKTHVSEHQDDVQSAAQRILLEAS
jgi:hypothetical protein